ncbi:MAG TPA: hypothetical protein PK530_06730, partial [Anaerolineales bacterium]|nr:hypothetical protein [Anaerolineales bacterium]
MPPLQPPFPHTTLDFFDHHMVGFGILNRELTIVEVGSLWEVLRDLQIGDLYGLSLLEIFPELDDLSDELAGLASQSATFSPETAPILHYLPEHEGQAYYFRFEPIPTLHTLLMIVVNVAGHTPLGLKYQEAQ